MERQPHRPQGGDHDQGVNSYGTDDPETQAHIENARIDAARERQQDRALFERLVELGVTPEDAETYIEFKPYLRDLRARTSTSDGPPEIVVPPRSEGRAEREQPRLTPRVYVVDLASQQHGVEHGAWIDATRDQDELEANIAAMLDSSPTPPGLPWDQAWTVGAAAEFAGLDLTGCNDAELIAELARGVTEWGAAYAAWATLTGIEDRDQLAKFSDFYVGSYDSPQEWARAMAEDLDWSGQLDREITDPFLRSNVMIDYAKMAREAAMTWDVVTGHDGRVHVFLR
jgi:antirestriction protein